jgi:hypothetical protein
VMHLARAALAARLLLQFGEHAVALLP